MTKLITSIYQLLRQIRSGNISTNLEKNMKEMKKFSDKAHKNFQDQTLDKNSEYINSIASKIDELSLEKINIEEEFKILKTNHRNVDFFPRDISLYENYDLRLPDGTIITSWDKIMISVNEHAKIIEYIIENYELLNYMPVTKEWLENMIIILNYITLFTQTIVEKKIRNPMKTKIISFIMLFISKWSTILVEILGELTWINELFLTYKNFSKNLQNIDSDPQENTMKSENIKFLKIKENIEKTISLLIKEQKLFIFYSNSIFKECQNLNP